MSRSHSEPIDSRRLLPRTVLHQRLIAIVFLLVMAFAVRALTANFIRAHLDDPGWVPIGIYAVFDRQAQDWLDGHASIFWIDDASQTDRATYAPGYALWLAFVYKLSGSRSPATVQNVQWVLDSFSVLLIVGIGVTAFDWRTGLCAGVIAALWPLLAIYGVEPLADAPTSWMVLTAVWSFLFAAKRNSVSWAIVAGALIGVSCWLRANALLLGFFWAIAILFLGRANWQRRTVLALSLVLGALLIVSPVIVRNAIAFHAFVPTGLGAGTNLLEGIGDFERGAKDFGAPSSDREVIEQERVAANVAPGSTFELYYPDGIQRDRARIRRAMEIISHHPFWYASTVVRRMPAVMKYAGQPNGIYGSAGINVTSKKSLPPKSQGGVISFVVNIIGMVQSVLRYMLLPLMLVGIYLAVRRRWRSSALILTTILYYLVVGSLMHTHIRYGLPMQALLTIFAAVTMIETAGAVSGRVRLWKIRNG